MEEDPITDVEAGTTPLLDALADDEEATELLELVVLGDIALDTNALEERALDATPELDATGGLEVAIKEALDEELAARIPAIWPSVPGVKDEGACLKKQTPPTEYLFHVQAAHPSVPSQAVMHCVKSPLSNACDPKPPCVVSEPHSIL